MRASRRNKEKTQEKFCTLILAWVQNFLVIENTNIHSS